MKPSLLTVAVRRALKGLGVPSAGRSEETIVVGLSGGADSVALLDALALLGRQQGFRVVAAHLDHGLRLESAGDAAFCRELCARLEVPIELAVADVRARARRDRGGIEEAAREERYAFLREVKRRLGAAAIAVAHTRDDQAETFLLRLLRGAGSLGLAAMRPRGGDVVRPLLAVSRADVMAHLASRGLSWREDSTNADLAFVRNRVRHELLPYLESRFNPAVREGLARTAGLLADEDVVLSQVAAQGFVAASRTEGRGVVLSRHAIGEMPRAVARRVVRQALESCGGLRGVAAAHVDKILNLSGAPAPSGRRLPLPGGREAVVRFDELWVGPRPEKVEPFAYPLSVPGRVDIPGGLAVVAQPAVSKEERDGAVVAVPAGRSLVVRTRRPGDRVRARGREVSLKRFLMDHRVPADVRGALPLVASGRQVLWIAGQAVAGPRGRVRSLSSLSEDLVRLELVLGQRGLMRSSGSAGA